MAYRILLDESVAIGAALKAVTESREAFQAAFEFANAQIEVLREALETAADQYNDAAGALREALDSAAERVRAEFDDASERWQESDRGQVVADWIDGLEGMQIDELQVSIDDAQFEVEWADEVIESEFRSEPEE